MTYFMQNQDDSWVSIVIFLIIVGISLFANVFKKLVNSQKKNSEDQPPLSKPRSRFFDLIEEVKRMAEEGGNMPPRPSGKQPPVTIIKQVDKEKYQQTVSSSNVPKLKPVGAVQKPVVISQKTKTTPVIQPYVSEEVAIRQQIRSQDEFVSDERFNPIEVGGNIEAREKALVAREEAIKKAEEQLSVLQSSIEDKRIRRDSKERKRMSQVYALEEIKDYTSIFESPESLKEAIILKEIIGSPRAKMRHKPLGI